MVLRVFEAFSGIGAQRMALRNLGIDHEVVGICEIDKHAIQSYEAIHCKTKNFGDISKVNPTDLPDFDLFTYSFPCQDLSLAGRGRGLIKGKTRSGLLYECEKIIEAKRPQYLLLENVKNLVSQKFKPQFDEWLSYLEGLGYTNHWAILNAKHYGIPQNRERVFVVSILGDEPSFSMPLPIPLTQTVFDFLEPEVSTNYYVEHPFEKVDGVYRIPQATQKGYIELKTGICDWSYPTSQFRRGRVQEEGKIVPTLTASRQALLYLSETGQARTLTSLERWRLMGFSDEDYHKAQQSGVSDAQLYKQAGNSIVVPVLEAIFRKLFLN